MVYSSTSDISISVPLQSRVCSERVRGYAIILHRRVILLRVKKHVDFNKFRDRGNFEVELLSDCSQQKVDCLPHT